MQPFGCAPQLNLGLSKLSLAWNRCAECVPQLTDRDSRLQTEGRNRVKLRPASLPDLTVYATPLTAPRLSEAILAIAARRQQIVLAA